MQTYLQAGTGRRQGARASASRTASSGTGRKPAGVCLTDPAAALAWAKENLPDAVTEAMDRKALAARLLDTGEALPFARLDARRRSLLHQVTGAFRWGRVQALALFLPFSPSKETLAWFLQWMKLPGPCTTPAAGARALFILACVKG